jgi:hypothetical protein
MTIEALKVESIKLSKLEKLEFLQFLVATLSDEERSSALTLEEERTLLRRRAEIASGTTQTIPAKKVTSKLAEKYGF